MCAFVCMCTFIWKMSISGFNGRRFCVHVLFMLMRMHVHVHVCARARMHTGAPWSPMCVILWLLPGLKIYDLGYGVHGGHIKLQNSLLLRSLYSCFMVDTLFFISCCSSTPFFLFLSSLWFAQAQLLITCLLRWSLQYHLLLFLSSVAFACHLTK